MGLTLPGWLRRSEHAPLSLDEWTSFFAFGGLQYPLMPTMTLTGTEEQIDASFAGYVQGAYKSNGIVFACMLARLLVFSEARFRFRRVRAGRPGELFGTTALSLVETPWANGSTGDLLARAIQDVDLSGNFFAARRAGGLKRLRPDWMTIIVGSENPDGGGAWDIDAELLGYAYQPGGPAGREEPVVLLPGEVAHWAPIPDPLFSFRGMSWLSPVLTEILGDKAAMSHKQRFFENGATVNQVVSLDASIGPDKFETWITKFEARHKGARNAYKTLYLGGGADLKAVGADMKQIDFKTVQGHGETRIAAAAGTPPVIVGLSEGLEAATYSNYGQARRRFADGTIRPLWRSFAGALSDVVDVPAGSELWYDDRDIPFLQEDRKDAAEIQETEARTIALLIREGYTPESVIAAVENTNWSLLKHTGLVSVQLHGPGDAPVSGGSPAPVPSANGNGA